MPPMQEGVQLSMPQNQEGVQFSMPPKSEVVQFSMPPKSEGVQFLMPFFKEFTSLLHILEHYNLTKFHKKSDEKQKSFINSLFLAVKKINIYKK